MSRAHERLLAGGNRCVLRERRVLGALRAFLLCVADEVCIGGLRISAGLDGSRHDLRLVRKRPRPPKHDRKQGQQRSKNQRRIATLTSPRIAAVGKLLHRSTSNATDDCWAHQGPRPEPIEHEPPIKTTSPRAKSKPSLLGIPVDNRGAHAPSHSCRSSYASARACRGHVPVRPSQGRDLSATQLRNLALHTPFAVSVTPPNTRDAPSGGPWPCAANEATDDGAPRRDPVSDRRSSGRPAKAWAQPLASRTAPARRARQAARRRGPPSGRRARTPARRRVPPAPLRP